MGKNRFETAYNNSGSCVDRIGATDKAVPDLSFTIKEIQERFTLQTAVMMSQSKPIYEFENLDKNGDEDAIEAAFDSPAVVASAGFDLTDIASANDAVRRGAQRIEDIRNLRAKIKEKERARRRAARKAENSDE